ncbi:MAG: class II aldolase/adducin family protein [Desulfovermiculus sp.]
MDERGGPKLIQEQAQGSDPVADLIQAGREAWLKGLVSGKSGNFSLRCREKIFITCSGICKGRLQPRDVIRVDVHSKSALDPGRVSSETAMHMAVYTAHPKAQAIVHVHPVFLLALEQAGAELLNLDLFEAAAVQRELVHVPALTPGSDDLARAVAEAAGAGRVVHMARHGLVCWGEMLEQALNLAEEVEALAKIQLLTGIWSRGRT